MADPLWFSSVGHERQADIYDGAVASAKCFIGDVTVHENGATRACVE